MNYGKLAIISNAVKKCNGCLRCALDTVEATVNVEAWINKKPGKLLNPWAVELFVRNHLKLKNYSLYITYVRVLEILFVIFSFHKVTFWVKSFDTSKNFVWHFLAIARN